MSATDGARLAARVAALREAMDLAGDRLTPRVAARAQADLDRVEDRLALGVDWTVVGLVGGTGSGKSSLFNAISGLEFAKVGVRRPTTARTAACVWAGDSGSVGASRQIGAPAPVGDAEQLLEFLQVDADRRIRRESALDAGDQDALAGLVLLDLPDHDSVDVEHARVVDRLLPLVDLLVWVVDPQKYADNALHGRYLQAMAERDGAMLVLVNQVDTVPASALERIVADVRRLLDEDGLPGVPVLATSAIEGTGIAAVRDELAAVVASSSMAARVAGLEISDVARRLADDLDGGAFVQGPTGPDRFSAVYRLAAACGVDAVESALREAVRPRRRPFLVRPSEPALATATGVRDAVVAAAGHGLPARWQTDLERTVGSGPDLQSAVASRLQDVSLPDVTGRGLGRWVILVSVVVTTVAALIGLLDLGVGRSYLGAGPAAVAALAAVIAVAAAYSERANRARAAAERADRFGQAARGAVFAAVHDVLHDPAARVVGEHLAARAAVSRGGFAGEPDRAGRADEGTPTADEGAGHAGLARIPAQVGR